MLEHQPIKNMPEFVEAIRVTMQPIGRANATAQTIEQLATILGTLIIPHVELADLAAGWAVIAATTAEEHEKPEITSRRKTCGELADLATKITPGETGHLEFAISAWSIWITSLESSPDPRHVTMVKTFRRELATLQETGAILQDQAEEVAQPYKMGKAYEYENDDTEGEESESEEEED